MKTRILGLVMAKDEWPTLGVAVTHALRIGIDHVAVLNHGSADDTESGLQLLAEHFPGRISIYYSHEVSFLQEILVTLLAKSACAESYDWVYVFDADEFLILEGEKSLGDFLESVPAEFGAVRYEIRQWLSPSDFRPEVTTDLLKVVKRALPSVFIPKSSELVTPLVEKSGLNFFDLKFQSKLIIRSEFISVLSAGAHVVRSVNSPSEFVAPEYSIYVAHLPMRSRRQLENKARQGEALVRSGFPPSHGWQSQMLYRISQRSGLDEFWARHSDSVEAVKSVPGGPVIVEDNAFSREIDISLKFSAENARSPRSKDGSNQSINNLSESAVSLSVLRDAFSARDEAVSSHRILLLAFGNVTSERDQLQGDLISITSERDQLQLELTQSLVQLDEIRESLNCRYTGWLRNVSKMLGYNASRKDVT